MVHVPGFLVNKIYEKGSLQNTKDGFELILHNRVMSIKTHGISQLKVTIDREISIPQEDIELDLNGRKFKVSNEPQEELIELSKNSKLISRAKGHHLSDGKHVIKISFMTHEYGGVSLTIKDTVGEVERLTIWKRIKRLFSRKKRKIVKKPILIEGELGGVPLDPDFSRVEAIIRREVPDRVPLFEFDIEIPIKEAFLGREIMTAEDDVEFYIRAGYDFVPVIPPFFTPRSMSQAEGEERGWVTESKGIIKTMEDFKNFSWPDPDDVDFSGFYEVGELLPPKMKILGLLSPAAVFGNTSQAMGLTNFSYALVDDIELVEALFEKIGSSYLRIAERLVEVPKLGAVLMSDDLAHTGGLLVNPKIYRKYVFPWYAKFGAILKKAGIPFLFHSDGDFSPVFNDLYDCGIRGINPIEPQAMDIEEVKKEYGDKFCIFGNIDLEYTLTRGTVDEVVALVKKRLKELGPGGGYGLSSSNSIPDYVKPENFKAMVETGKKYGKYPIKID